MLRILSRSHSEDTATGYMYRVKHEGSTKTMEENELLSIPAGLAALDEFDQRHVYKAASPSKRQKIEDEATRYASMYDDVWCCVGRRRNELMKDEQKKE